MIPDKVPEGGVYHAPEELKKEAHISSYDKFRELYLRSVESPDGESFRPQLHPPTADRGVGRKVPQGSS